MKPMTSLLTAAAGALARRRGEHRVRGLGPTG